MTEFGFIRVIFVAGIVAILVQCAVYPVRHWLGMAVARRMLDASLYGFLAVTAACLVWGGISGQLAQGLAAGGWRTLADMTMFFGFGMFISYFMGARYLSDELERARVDTGQAAADSASDDRDGEN